jgi:hypothetical protein
MKSSFATLAILAALSNLVVGVVHLNLGQSNGDDLVWISGQNPCDAIIITSSDNDPCGIPFTLKTGTYKVRTSTWHFSPVEKRDITAANI